MDALSFFKGTAAQLEQYSKFCSMLTRVRHIHETDEQTLERMIRLAMKITCGYCRGYGHGVVSSVCHECHGLGEVPYDPRIKPVEEVIQK